MTPTEIKREIDHRLASEYDTALDYWAGCCKTTINDIIIHAQNLSVDDAVELIKELAK